MKDVTELELAKILAKSQGIVYGHMKVFETYETDYQRRMIEIAREMLRFLEDEPEDVGVIGRVSDETLWKIARRGQPWIQ